MQLLSQLLRLASCKLWSKVTLDSERLKIIVALPEPPDPMGNAAARWYFALLNTLATEKHCIRVLSSYSNAKHVEVAKRAFQATGIELQFFSHRPGGTWTSRWETIRRPYSYQCSQEMRQAFKREVAKGYDVIHVEQLWTGWLACDYSHRSLINIHHLQSIDLEKVEAPSLREKLENQLIFRTERKLVGSFENIRACSPRLVPKIQSWNDAAHVGVVPVGIDSSRYHFTADRKSEGAPIVTLIGQMGWYPSYSAAVRLLERQWPMIKAEVPAAKLRVVGWGARSALSKYLSLPDVAIIENVPDIYPYFEEANAFVYAPARGSGMKIKILEAMAFGVPVVTTSEGVEGLPADDGVHAGISDGDEGFVRRVVELLGDPAKQQRQRVNARQLVEDHCSPVRTVNAIKDEYKRILELA